jgi:hypothetical protein
MENVATLIKKSPFSIGASSIAVNVENVFENIGPYIDDFLPELLQFTSRYPVSTEHIYKPRHWCHYMYGCGDLWWLILLLNNMQTPMDFFQSTVVAPTTNSADMRKTLELIIEMNAEAQRTAERVSQERVTAADMMIEPIV